MVLTYQKLVIMKKSNAVEAIAVQAMRYQNGNLFETLKSMYNNNSTSISFDEDVFRLGLQKTSSRRPETSSMETSSRCLPETSS